MAFYIKRIIDSLLDLKMQSFGATLIVGPKGCGKTTSAKRKANSVIEFQDENVRDKYLSVANTMPSKLLTGKTPRLFDEWQDAPQILGAICKSVENLNKPGLFLLTGAHTNVYTHNTKTSKISTLKMYPLSLYESLESTGAVSLSDLFKTKNIDLVESKLYVEKLIFAICRGGWPKSLLSDTTDSPSGTIDDLFYQICHNDISKIDNVKRDGQLAREILRAYSKNIFTLADTKTIIEDVNSTARITKPTYYKYVQALEKLYIIENIPAWCPPIRSKDAIRTSKKINLIDPSIAVTALQLNPTYLNTDLITLESLFKSLCIRDLKIYSSKLNGKIAYYQDRYGLKADAVLYLKDGRYALINFKLGFSQEIEDGAKQLLEIERLIIKANNKNTQNQLRLPDLKIIITTNQYGYKREDGVFVIPIGCLKD